MKQANKMKQTNKKMKQTNKICLQNLDSDTKVNKWEK